MLEKEYKYFLAHKDTLLKDHEGKFIVIIADEVVGSYPSREAALKDAPINMIWGHF